MPFRSEAQRRFMYATDPKMAKRFEKKTKKKNLPEKVKKSPMDLAWRLLKMPQEARDFASQVHEGQMYGEEPYMTHIEDVASQFDDPHLKRIAYLHDAVEDSETGIDAIHQQFGEDVGHAIDALTRRPDEQYFDYIQRVASHPEARQVKLADLQSNLRRGPSESLARRYEKALQMLRGDM